MQTASSEPGYMDVEEARGAAMTCRCQDSLHEGKCPYWELAHRYHDIYMRAHRRFIRREVARNRMRLDLDDSEAERTLRLVDEAWALREHLGALWMVASSPQLLRQLTRDLALFQKEA